MNDYKTLYDAIVNLNIPIEKQGKFANDKDLWFEYAHFPYIGKGNQSDAVDLNTPLTFEAKADNTKIYFLAYNADVQTRTIEVSTDNGETYTEFTSETYNEDNNTPIATLNLGQKMLVRGDNQEGMGYYDDDEGGSLEGGGFYIVGEAYVYGNVMSLLDSTNFASMTSVPEHAFACLFCDSPLNGAWNNDGSLFSHPSKKLLLPATMLASDCYNGMFYSCANLTTVPELPATTLAERCYISMFANCTGLSAAPELPAITMVGKCYYGMFSGCTSLTTAPKLLATTLAEGCYQRMFYCCTSLMTASELPAIALASSCYSQMFYGCTRLAVAPELPATTLMDNCYDGMFYNCTSLTSAPELPATTLVAKCYHGMFDGCTSLRHIKAMFTTTPSDTFTQNWVRNVSANGTFVKNSAATWNVTGTNGIPTGWTVETA